MAPVTVEHFTDPFSPSCWAAQPTLRRLAYEFDDVTWTPRTTLLFPEAPVASRPTVDGQADDDRTAEEAGPRWAAVAASTGMPVTEDLWSGGVPSSRVACAAVAFVRETAPDRAPALLRSLRVAVFAEGRRLEDPEAVAELAGRVPGVDERAVRSGLDDGRAAAALRADLDRAVAVAEERATVEVRGDIALLPGVPRLAVASGRAPVADGPDEPTTPAETSDPPDRPVADDGTGDAVRADDGTEPSDAALAEGDEPDADPVLVGPPTLRVETTPAGGATTVVLADARLPFGRLATAFGRSVPKGGYEVDDKFATSRMALHVPRGMAEALSSQDFGAEIRPYLDRFGSVYLPEIVEATGVTTATCRRVLESMAARGEVERVGPAGWRTVDTAGGPHETS